MPCTPYTPTSGTFTYVGWGSVPTSGSWTFEYDRDFGGDKIYRLSHDGDTKDELRIDEDHDVRWIFFGNYLAVNHYETLGAATTYHVEVYTLDASAASLSPVELNEGPYAATGGTPELQFHRSPDNLAFFICISGDAGTEESHHHRVFRSGQENSMCSHATIRGDAGPRQAEITPDDEIKIKTPTRDYETCPLPRGELEVVPASRTFPDAVVGGTPELASTTAEFTLRNGGSDCLTVQRIDNIAPFSVTSTSRPLPVDLEPGDEVSVEVTFNPSTVDSFGPVDLNIVYSPAGDPRALSCEGESREPRIRIAFNHTRFNFGSTPVGDTRRDTLVISNDGETSLPVSLAASSGSSPFQWSAYSGTLNDGDSEDVDLTFTPTAEGDVSATLTVVSGDPDSPHDIRLLGEGCVANAEIREPSTLPIDFGPIQRGFRTVRFFTVRNVGDGPLNFRASMGGADAALFGLQPPSGEVTDVMAVRHYTVDPEIACGAISTGSGEVIVAVAFYANDVPRTVSSELIIDNHNATNTATTRWVIPLQAEIIAVESIDAALVLDRSGSMGDDLGSRRKIDAAIAGGRLFAQLSRENVEDRLTIIRYNASAEAIQPIIEITDANKATLVNQVSHANFEPDGSTAIAGGIMVGGDQLATARTTIPPILHKAIVVLTDGKDNTGYRNPADGRWYSLLGGFVHEPGTLLDMVDSEPVPLAAGVKVYGIGLGREEDVDHGRLDRICSATGTPFRVTGDLTDDAYFTLEKYFTEIYMEVASAALILDPVYSIEINQEHRIDFQVLRGDVSALIVVYDRQGMRLPFHLETETGEIIDVTMIPPGYQLRSGATETARFVEVRMPQDEEDRYAGHWQVVLNHPGEFCAGIPDYGYWHTGGEIPRHAAASADDVHMRFGFVSGEQCVSFDEPIDYGIAIGVGSNFRLQAFVTPNPVHTGEPILLTALVSEAGLPVTGCHVTVAAVSPSGMNRNLTLYDDGFHDDGDEDDAEYAGLFTHTAEAGSYTFTFRAEGTSRDGEPVVREATRSKYVEGRIAIDPDPGNPQQAQEDCCRWLKILLAACGLILLGIFIVLLVRL